MGSSFHRQELQRDFTLFPSHGSTELHTYVCIECCRPPPMPSCTLPYSLLPACPNLLSSAHSLFEGFLGQGTGGRVDTSFHFAMDKVGN